MIERDKIKQKTIGTLRDLVGFETTKDKPDQILKAIDYLKSRAEAVGGLFIESFINEDSPSLVISTHKTLSPDVALNAHIDVVPASKKMFTMREDDEKLFGRGVFDMKFSIAVFIELLEHLPREKTSPSVALILTSDEEVGSARGAKYLAEKIGYRPKLVITPDGGKNWQLVEEAKAAIHMKITTTGKSAHASKPWLGENSNDSLINIYELIRKKYPLVTEEDWQAVTMNLGIIKGGTQANQVPDSSEMLLDFRFPENHYRQEIIDSISEILPKTAVLKVVAEAYLTKVDPNNPAVKLFTDIVKEITRKKVVFKKDYGSTDARFWGQYGTPCIIIAPPGDEIHSDHEWIDIEGMTDLFFIFHKYLQTPNIKKLLG